MASLTGLFRRGASYYLKVVLPLNHPARAQYRSGRQVVSLGACSFREALTAGTIRRAEILRAELFAPLALTASPLADTLSPPLPTLREVFGRWGKSKTTRSTDSVGACGRALALFEGYAGAGITLDKITRTMGDGFRAWLLEPARGTTTKTARDRFTWVKSLLKYANRDLGLPPSPWVGLDIESRTATKRKPWKPAELALLFGQPLHARHELPPAWNAGGDAAYWLPLLGLYTGARLSELAQLTPADVGEEDGIHFLDLNDDGPGKRLKTEAGRRRVPIHAELLRLGLLQYVEGKRGALTLWPDLRQRDGKPGGYFSAWFGTYRRNIGLGDRPDFHCYRHTVRTALAQAGIRDDTIDAVLGHEPGGSTGVRVYTYRPLQELHKAVQLLPAAATFHLRPAERLRPPQRGIS